MSNQEDRFDFSDSENHGNQGERYRKSSEDKNDNGKADGINWGDKIFSMIQESAESMDFAELSHNIQKTIDVAREETMKQVSFIPRLTFTAPSSRRNRRISPAILGTA